MNWTLPLYDDHREGHYEVTVPQLALFLIWSLALVLWTLRWPNKGNKKSARTEDITAEANGGKEQTTLAETPRVVDGAASATEERPNGNIRVNEDAEGGASNHDNKVAGGEEAKPVVHRFSAIKPPPTFHDFLGCVLQLGVILFFFFLTDYVKILPKGDRIYSRDMFLFILFLFFLVGSAFTMKPTADKILNRDITEEWKGWMQVLFVWYHYFAAAEWYNWIRVYIAAYVWMTGFGNFSFFWVRKDYSIWRSLKMLFRLNFLVLLMCATVSNEYMLYYICPMHTYWFLSVYAFMGIARSLNESRWGMILKFTVYAVINSIIFDIPGVALYVFRPFWFFLGFNDGRGDIMHEWSFRLGLDHWACFIGMVCAYNYPMIESALKRVEELTSRWREILIKLAVCLPVVAIFIIWHQMALVQMDKFAFNVVHPYTSFIPVVTFILLRNLFPILRTHYIDMFAWLGKITLETYISQLHIYLQSNAKHRLIYIAGYPQLNFAFNTIIYLSISYSLFNLTTDFSAYLLPKDTRQLVRSIVMAILVIIVAMVAAFLFKHLVMAL